MWSSQPSVASVPVWSRQSGVASVPVWSSRSGVEQSRVEQTSVEQSSVDSTQGESVLPVGSLGFRLYKEAIGPDRTAPEFRCPRESSGSSLRKSRIESSRAEFESTTAKVYVPVSLKQKMKTRKIAFGSEEIVLFCHTGKVKDYTVSDNFAEQIL